MSLLVDNNDATACCGSATDAFILLDANAIVQANASTPPGAAQYSFFGDLGGGGDGLGGALEVSSTADHRAAALMGPADAGHPCAG